MYLYYGSSLKSEKDAYDSGMGKISELDVTLDSVRLDRYYSSPSYADSFGNAKVFVIRKKNATLNGSWKWKDTMKEFVTSTAHYLAQYHKRRNSESGFAADKKCLDGDSPRSVRIGSTAHKSILDCGTICSIWLHRSSGNFVPHSAFIQTLNLRSATA